VRRIDDDERVAVGRCLGSDIDADGHAGTRAMVDHHLLAPGIGVLLTEHARHLVGAAGGRGRHDEADGPGGIALRRGVRHAANQRGGTKKQARHRVRHVSSQKKRR